VHLKISSRLYRYSVPILARTASNVNEWWALFPATFRHTCSNTAHHEKKMDAS